MDTARPKRPFQSTPPVKAATAKPKTSVDSELFQSTPPVKAATKAGAQMVAYGVFQSTPPVKAATILFFSCLLSFKFQSTPPVKAATHYFARKRNGCSISIHAAREGGDVLGKIESPFSFISIHAAREGGDGARHLGLLLKLQFQSTPPVKAAT